ncbi:hypothetical protein, partial [Pseudovibrio brasiliensis]|uniref:hypothetical protein n=2 Tax=Pseudovibrio brasiliensis TaxID=1898042 RepID=UPI001AD8F525
HSLARPGGVERVIGVPAPPVNTQISKKPNYLRKTKIQTKPTPHISFQSPRNTPQKPHKQAKNNANQAQ